MARAIGGRKMKTDLNRLHRVALGENSGRKSGETYYYCHLVAGVVELGNKEVIIKIPSLKSGNYIKPMLEEVLKNHKLNIIKKSNRECWLLANGARLIFETLDLDGYSRKSAIVFVE